MRALESLHLKAGVAVIPQLNLGTASALLQPTAVGLSSNRNMVRGSQLDI